MDAFEALFHRPSVKGLPFTLIVRNCAPGSSPAALENCWELLDDRRQPDEVMLLHRSEPAPRPASRLGARSIRCVVRPDADSGEALAWCFEHAERPLVALLDAARMPSRKEFAELMESLEIADLAVGRRRKLGGLDRGRWFFAKLMRWTFGVQAPDPLSPVKSFRRRAVVGIPLTQSGTLADFELLGKLTFLTCLLNEIQLDSRRGDDATLGATLWRRRRDLWQLWNSPRFWDFDPAAPRFRALPAGPLEVEKDRLEPARLQPLAGETLGDAIARISNAAVRTGGRRSLVHRSVAFRG